MHRVLFFVWKQKKNLRALRLEKEKEPEKWENLDVGGVDGISCQQLQVMVMNLLVVRPTMYMASLDIKTAFDVAKILDSHNTHGWLIAAFLREKSGLSGMASFECVESCFSFKKCLRQGSVEAPRLWKKMEATPDLGQCGERMDEEKKRYSLVRRRRSTFCGLTIFGSCPTRKKIWNRCWEIIQEAIKLDLETKLASLWWTSTYTSEKIWFDFGYIKGMLQMFLWRRIQDIGLRYESWRKRCDPAEECSRQTRPSGKTLWYTRGKMFRGK